MLKEFIVTSDLQDQISAREKHYLRREKNASERASAAVQIRAWPNHTATCTWLSLLNKAKELTVIRSSSSQMP